MLRSDLGYKFAAHSPIHNPDKREIHFNLAYATNHFEGMEVMRNAEFVALSEHDRIRFAKNNPRQQDDLFGGSLEVVGPYLRARKQHLSDASEVLQRLMSASPNGIQFLALAAKAQQSLYLKRAELGSVIVQMASEGLIEKTWLLRGGKRPGPGDMIKKTKK